MRAVQGTDCIDPCCESESGSGEGSGPDLLPCKGARELGERIVSLGFKEDGGGYVLSCVWGYVPDVSLTYEMQVVVLSCLGLPRHKEMG